MNKPEALIFLRKALNNLSVDFREGQWEAIDSVVNKNKKLLLVQRTGWEKILSIFFQQEFYVTGGKELQS